MGFFSMMLVVFEVPVLLTLDSQINFKVMTFLCLCSLDISVLEQCHHQPKSGCTTYLFSACSFYEFACLIGLDGRLLHMQIYYCKVNKMHIHNTGLSKKMDGI